MSTIKRISVERLKPNPNQVRTHPKGQIDQLAESIKEFGFVVPIVADENMVTILGTARILAARKLRLKKVPVIVVEGLSEARKRALALADNKIAEKGGVDRKALAKELSELREILLEDGLDIEITGFSEAEIDQIVIEMEDESREPSDDVPSTFLKDDPVSRYGDEWLLNDHRLRCGDAGDLKDLREWMAGERARMAFLDEPYNRNPDDIGNKGRTKHERFAMASGELSADEFCEKLRSWLRAAAAVSHDGAVHYVCMDWRICSEVIRIGNDVYGKMLNLVVWAKTNAGMGSFYRSQHELIGVFRVGDGAHLNNVQLGKFKRSRSNLWTYAGANTFRAGRLDELRAHPTPKPVALVVDAMRDCTRRGDVVLDTFCGSGTTLLAAERVGRRAFCLDIEPRYVDVAIRRWQAFTRRDAVHAVRGLTFNEMEEERRLKKAKIGPLKRLRISDIFPVHEVRSERVRTLV